jgi:ABC-type phosphate/phosphonate transport system substrate-binding protein
LILVRRDSVINSVADLRGKRIAIPRGGRNSLAPIWIDTLLMDNSLGEGKSFFKEVREVQKPTQAILPVFFSQIEAAVVAKAAFETSSALNPQVGQQLKVLATSPPFVPMIICMRSSIASDTKAMFLQKALKLHEISGGLQSFNVFKIERLAQWQPRYTDNVRELLRKYGQIKSAEQSHNQPQLPASIGVRK